MASKTLTTIAIIFGCIIIFPIAIGVIGGLFGLVMGVFGAVFGVIGGVLGGIFGTIGGIFGWIFGGCSIGFFHWNFLPMIALIIIVVLISQRSSRRGN